MPGDAGRDGLELAANAVGGVGLRVEGFVLRRAAGHVEQDARLRRAAAPSGAACAAERSHIDCSRPSPRGASTPAWRKVRRFIASAPEGVKEAGLLAGRVRSMYGKAGRDASWKNHESTKYESTKKQFFVLSYFVFS